MKKPDELYYEYTTKYYMLYYRGKPLGGAGIAREARGCRANLKLFKECAERDKQAILNGRGDKRYLEVIDKIDLEEERK